MKSGEVKLFVGILVVAIVLAGIAVVPALMEKREPPIVTISDDLDPKRLIPEGSHIIGDPNAPFTLVEFTDYQCGGCRSAIADVAALMRQHKGKLKVVLHSIQVTAQHTLAPLMTQAAEAAAMQGKWEAMHHALFANQDKFQQLNPAEAEKVVGTVARDAGIDLLRFQADLVSPRAKAALQRGSTVAQYASVHSTPAFIFVPPVRKGMLQFRNLPSLKQHLAKPATWQVPPPKP